MKKSLFSIRGRLGSSSLFFRNVGTLIGYVLGATVEYKIIPCISAIIPIVFVICFMLMPNTPQYHLRKGQTQVRNADSNHTIGVQVSKSKRLFFESKRKQRTH